MSRRGWTRSLYWRIGLGLLASLGVALVAEAALFVWLAGATEGGMPERMGRDFAELVATEIESALGRDPGLDLEAFARSRIENLHRPAVVFLADGRVVAPPDVPLPPVRPRFGAMGPGMLGPRAGRREGAAEGWAPGMRPFFPGPRRMPAMAPVVAGGRVIAVVWVPPLTGIGRIVSELGPWLALGPVLLIAGTLVAALAIFRPTQARLNALEEAARRLGEGDTAARAPEIGGDEVAAVARAFNRMAAELSARQAQLVDADRARRQLLADVSHELMTPLTAIRGYAETLGLPQFRPATEDGQRAVRVIQEEGERIERLVGDLLDLARYEAGGVSLAVESVAVDALVARAIDRHAQAARDKGVALVAAPIEEGLIVNADPHRLEQALQNLASNALRHTPAGGTVTIGASRDERAVRLTVADTGAGIAAEHLPHVFDRFYKADRARAQFGSGLGLSIVRAIVERHGGTVSVRSTPGVETLFEIVLPNR